MPLKMVASSATDSAKKGRWTFTATAGPPSTARFVLYTIAKLAAATGFCGKPPLNTPSRFATPSSFRTSASACSNELGSTFSCSFVNSKQ